MKETIKSVEVDLPEREEFRFIFPVREKAILLQLLREKFDQVVFSERSISRTIYFNNQSHEVPWEYSLKARQYFPARILADTPWLDLNEPYFVEIKSSVGEFGRSKKRYEMTLAQATEFLAENVHISGQTAPLRPYIADEYERFHFQPRKAGPQTIRITCDTNPTYFLISEGGIIHLLGEEPSVRIEVKIASGQNMSELEDFLIQLQVLGARKTVSKKIAAYSLESGYYKSTDGLPQKELTDTEIEAKLLVVDPNPSLFFNQLTTKMREGIGEFIIQATFPYVLEGGSFNSYYQTQRETERDGIKFLARPTVAKAVLKSDSEIISDPYRLGCILKRREIRSEYFPLIQDELDKILKAKEGELKVPFAFIGEMERLRKAFWVINKNTRRTYHVSIDRCRAEGRIFYQLEIEYTGIKAQISLHAEPEIIKDIADLTKSIIDAYPLSVHPAPLTKLEWLRKS